MLFTSTVAREKKLLILYFRAQNRAKPIVVDSRNATGKFGIDFEIYADENYTNLINLSR